MFEKTLQDIVKGIRSHKKDPSAYISQVIAECKNELRNTDPFVKTQAIRKLTYLQMIGYDISWAAFGIIEVMSLTRFFQKRIGSLAACQSFNDQTEVVLLATNMLKKEFDAPNYYEVGLALNTLSNIATRDLSRDLLQDVTNLMNHQKPYVRKKAILTMYKLFVKYPQGLRLTFENLKEKLDDSEASVVSASVNVICELADKNPRNYLAMAPKFFYLMTTSSNNWMLIKVVKLLGSLVPEEPRLARKLLEPLSAIIQNTSAKSLQYECIYTLTLALQYTKRSDGTDSKNAPVIVRLCSEHLRQFVEDPDQNLKFLGLVGFIELMRSNPKAVVDHRELVLRCLSDDDVTIRNRALELLTGMVTKRNLQDLVRKLLQYVVVAEGTYRDELIQKIIFMCSRDKYAYLSDFAWYLAVLVDLANVQGTSHGKLVSQQLMDITIRVDTIQRFSVESMLNLLLDRNLILGENRDVIAEVLNSVAWITGEYSHFLVDISKDLKKHDEEKVIQANIPPEGLFYAVIDALAHPVVTNLPFHVQNAFIQSLLKVFAVACVHCDDGTLRKIIDLLDVRLGIFLQSVDVEIQERTSTLHYLLTSLGILKKISKHQNASEEKVVEEKQKQPKNKPQPASKPVQNIDLLLELSLPSPDLLLSDKKNNFGETQSFDLLAVNPSSNDSISNARQFVNLLKAAAGQPFPIVPVNPKAQLKVPHPEDFDIGQFLSEEAKRLLDDDNIKHCDDMTVISFTQLAFVREPEIHEFKNPIANHYDKTSSDESDHNEKSKGKSKKKIKKNKKMFEPFSAITAQEPPRHSDFDAFYLSGTTSTRAHEDDVESIPVIRLTDEDFHDVPDKKKKKNKKRSNKTKDDMNDSNQQSINVQELMPAGAEMSDDGEYTNPRHRGTHKTRKGNDDLDLQDVDLTKPLGPDEKMPVNQHRVVPTNQIDESSKNATSKNEKLSKKDKQKKKKKNRDGDDDDDDDSTHEEQIQYNDLLLLDFSDLGADSASKQSNNNNSNNTLKNNNVTNDFFQDFTLMTNNTNNTKPSDKSNKKDKKKHSKDEGDDLLNMSSDKKTHSHQEEHKSDKTAKSKKLILFEDSNVRLQYSISMKSSGVVVLKTKWKNLSSDLIQSAKLVVQSTTSRMSLGAIQAGATVEEKCDIAVLSMDRVLNFPIEIEYEVNRFISSTMRGNATLTIPIKTFLQPNNISSDNFASALQSQKWFETSTRISLQTSHSISSIAFSLSKVMNMSIVDEMQDSVSLYAVTPTGIKVGILIKVKLSEPNKYKVTIKSTHQALGDNILPEIKNAFQNINSS